jgi:CubicO group peptidase (beta-lactamase class C family)
MAFGFYDFCKDQGWMGCLGDRRVLPSREPLLIDSAFDLASVTKIFVTASLAAVLIERGHLRWDTPLASILTDFPDRAITVEHLLSHTSGLPSWRPFWEQMRDRFGDNLHNVDIEERERYFKSLVYSVEREKEIGVEAVYSDLSFLLLGWMIEELMGQRLDVLAQRLVWDKMDIQGAYFRRVTDSVSLGRDNFAVATEDCPWRKGVLQGQVHDDNCFTLGGIAGHAGAFGTVESLLKFSKAWLSGRFVAPLVRDKMWEKFKWNDRVFDRTRGWDVVSGPSPSAGTRFSLASVGHLGFTGTSLWIDPLAQVAIVLLTNRVHPTRENIMIREFRPIFHTVLWDEVNE